MGETYEKRQRERRKQQKRQEKLNRRKVRREAGGIGSETIDRPPEDDLSLDDADMPVKEEEAQEEEEAPAAQQ